MVRSDSCVLAGEGPLPKLSIVIPVYNERYLVGELLRRVAAAGIPSAGDIEIVVVDIDDLYQEDHYGAEMLHALERARRFNHWLAAALRPLLGDRVLEIGAGIGSISIWLLPRERYVVSEVNPDYLHYLGNLIRGKPYMAAARLDIEEPNAVAAMGERFDTVLGLHLLERVAEPAARLLPWRGLGMIAAARQPH